MKPTLEQIICNPDKIIAALEEQGVVYARPIVNALLPRILGVWQSKKMIKKLYRNKNRTLKNVVKERPSRKRGLASKQYISDIETELSILRPVAAQIRSKLESKVAKWPDLNLKPEDLQTRISGSHIRRFSKKTKISG
jgi:hypothetical protein